MGFYLDNGAYQLTASEEASGADQDRTDDLRLAKPALSQLSYSPDNYGGPGQS